MTAEGVVVALPSVSHEILGQLTGVRRPSVTSALGRLRDRGLLAGSSRGRWVLAGDPPALADVLDRSPTRLERTRDRARDARRAAREARDEAHAVQGQSEQSRRAASRHESALPSPDGV